MKIGILISGRGSNMMALADAVAAGHIPGAEIVVVISDHGEAAGLVRAAERGIVALAIERKGRTRLEHDREILSALRLHGVELVCLAGYMRLLSTEFIEAYRNRILNIHPSLLPSFPGLDPQRQAIEHGVKWTGCTVHFVDETLDGGPIISQQPVLVQDDDTVETLSARILISEHRTYPKAVATVVGGKYELVGRRFERRPKDVMDDLPQEVEMEKVNIENKLALFKEQWQPKIVGELNGQYVKLVKFQGPFVWHHHDQEDELFLVVKGRFRMEFKDRSEWIEEGEFIVVPRGIEHRPVAEEEAHVLLFEPISTLNTGNVEDRLTLPELERI